MNLFAAIERLSRIMALAGGCVLLAIAVMTVISVTGRALVPFGLSPIPGDFELVEAGIAFAVFAFLPWCHLKGGHAQVDIFARFFAPKFNQFLERSGDAIIATLMVLIAWRLGLATWDKFNFGETSFILQFPQWWAYGLSLIAAILAALISGFIALFGRQETASLPKLAH